MDSIIGKMKKSNKVEKENMRKEYKEKREDEIVKIEREMWD